jgi:hypothetical protein
MAKSAEECCEGPILPMPEDGSNGMIDKSPLMIARCTDVADVVTAVNFARQNDLKVAIRGGGHNGPGLGSVDDGLMIDLSMMKGVRVNPTACTVRVGPGCTQGDVDQLPIYPRQRPNCGPRGRSGRCQEPTFRPNSIRARSSYSITNVNWP